MQMTWFPVCCFLLISTAFSFGQIESNEVSSEIHRFPFGDPFGYYPPGPGGDAFSGMADMFFPSNDVCLINGTYHNAYFVFDKNWNNLGKLPFSDGAPFHLSSTRYVVLASFRAMTNAWVYSRKDFSGSIRQLPLATHQFETSGRTFEYGSGFITGNLIFGFDDARTASSWELAFPSKVVYRDKVETSQWLSDYADTFGGYHWDRGGHFGPLGENGFQLALPVIRQVNFTLGKPFGIQSLDEHSLGFVGTDNKGLIYAYTLLPWQSQLNYQPSSDRTICFVVIDPWQKKALFRALKPGEHISQDAGLPDAISPDGNIYFFDIDVPGKQFILNRIDNTWWDELGLTHTLSATVNDNRVRIRDKPGTQGQILDYLYENEVTRITDQTPQSDEVSGVKAPWYRISMPDGRQGWVFGEFLNLENQ
jgi:hypothetical protein